jgi:hypothetical protein
MSNKVTLNGAPIQGSVKDNLKRGQEKYFENFARPNNNVKDLDKHYYRSRIDDRSVDIPSLINRDTEVQSLVRILKETGGFDDRLWNPPKVARIRSTGEEYLYDGDHSRALWRIFRPGRPMPVSLVDVDTKAEIHVLFIRSNAKCKTAMKAEQIFVHEYHGGDKDAIDMKRNLDQANLRIYCSHEDGGSVGANGGLRIKIGAARSAFSAQEKSIKVRRRTEKPYDTAVRDSVKMLENAGCSRDDEDLLPGELLQGLVMVLGCYPALRPGGVDHQVVQDWLTVLVASTNIKQLAVDLKTKGDALVNYAGYSVARGILRDLKANPSTRAPALKGLKKQYRSSALNRAHGPKRK